MKLALSLWLAASLAAIAVDFTPTEVKESGEGGEATYLRFKDTKKDVTYMPPKDWEFRGSGAKFFLAPKDVAGAEMTITEQPFPEPPLPSPTSLKVFEELARTAVPRGATNVETVLAAFNPMEISGRQTVEVTVSYVFFGQAVKASYLYLARGESLMKFYMAARPQNFDQLRRTFHASLHSISGLRE